MLANTCGKISPKLYNCPVEQTVSYQGLYAAVFSPLKKIYFLPFYLASPRAEQIACLLVTLTLILERTEGETVPQAMTIW